jgi:predicted AAA+ superfamily ATPase
LRGAFNLIKTVFTKLVKTDMTKSLDPKIANVLVQNKNQCIGRIMENILLSDLSLLRVGFNQLKLNLSGTKTAQSRI